ncbi:MAG: hypothetical protein ACK4VO_06405 [Pseudobdellovibrio sp.]
MKTITRNLMTAICLMATLSVKQFANAGGSTGSGNGGEGFSIQSISEENPGLSKYEVLLEAFKRSEGRVPEAFKNVNFDEKEICLLPKDKSKGINIDASEFMSQIEKFCIIFDIDGVINPGPIFGEKVTEVYPNTIVLNPLFYSNFYKNLKLVISDKSAQIFLLSYDSKYQLMFEMRQLNLNQVIYVQYPTNFNSPTALCGNYKRPSKSGICEVGYIWSH